MEKTLVNIYDPRDPLAAYLFLKQYYAEGDRLMFISTREEKAALAVYASMFKVPEDHVELVWFHRSEDKYIYERICRHLRSRLSQDATYWVNLAGGSRYSAIAVQYVFAGFHSKFFYVQTRENLVVSSFFDASIDDNDDVIEPIDYRMSLAEYFELHGVEHDLKEKRHTPLRSWNESKRIFECFKARKLPDQAFSAIDQLRLQYRGKKHPYSIASIVRGVPNKEKPIKGLPELLRYFAFIPSQEGLLQPEEVDFLTGGWFEEYVYHTIMHYVRPQEAAVGVRISRAGAQHNNELDVVFIKANTLFVVECKTGIATDHMFNEIVYKASALKNCFLGMMCHSYIFTLKNDYDKRLKQVSDMMNITLCAKDTMVSPAKMAEVTAQILRQAHEQA